MYEGLSQDFLRIMKLPAQRKRIRGTLNGQAITGKNIIKNSVRISNQCSDNNEVSIGKVFVGQLNLTLKNISNIVSWKQLKGKEIILYEGLMIDDIEETYEDVKIGHYTIDDASSTVDGIECVAYDNMSKFDKEMNLVSYLYAATPYSLMSYACSECGVTLGMSQQEMDSMPNGTKHLVIYSENDMDEYRDLVSWVAQSMGANALINRDGELIFKCYDDVENIVDSFTAKDRMGNSGKCSGFETFYTSLSITNIKESTTSYYDESPNNGLMMELGSNPLLQTAEILDPDYDQEEVDERRENVLDAIQTIHYTPFSNIRLHRPFVYDLMDIVELTGGIIGEGVEVVGCITKYEWSFLGGFKIQCSGQDPALAYAKSRTDKVVSGLTSTTKEIKTSVSTVQQEVEQQQVDLSGKQNRIDLDLLPPSGSGEDGNLVIVGASGSNKKDLYRKDGNSGWTFTTFGIDYGTTDIGVGADLETGKIYFVYEA